MMTGYFGVPGNSRGRWTVHLVDDGKPVCGTRMPRDSEFQSCATGIHIQLIECKICRKRAATMLLPKEER